MLTIMLGASISEWRTTNQLLSRLALRRRVGAATESLQRPSRRRRQPPDRETTGGSHFTIRAFRILRTARVQYHRGRDRRAERSSDLARMIVSPKWHERARMAQALAGMPTP